MHIRIGAWLLVLVSLLALAGPSRAGYIQIAGAETSYNALTETFSVSGNASIGPSICCGQVRGTGYQSLIAQIDNDGLLLGGTYSLFGTLPGSGITTPTLLISAQIARVSIHAAANDPADPTAGGGISMNIWLDDIQVDPLLDLDANLGGWGATATYCCDAGAFGAKRTAIATPQTPWAGSWSGYFAADYSDIRSSTPLSEPGGLALVSLGLAGIAFARRDKPFRTGR